MRFKLCYLLLHVVVGLDGTEGDAELGTAVRDLVKFELAIHFARDGRHRLNVIQISECRYEVPQIEAIVQELLTIVVLFEQAHQHLGNDVGSAIYSRFVESVSQQLAALVFVCVPVNDG